MKGKQLVRDKVTDPDTVRCCQKRYLDLNDSTAGFGADLFYTFIWYTYEVNLFLKNMNEI